MTMDEEELYSLLKEEFGSIWNMETEILNSIEVLTEIVEEEKALEVLDEIEQMTEKKMEMWERNIDTIQEFLEQKDRE